MSYIYGEKITSENMIEQNPGDQTLGLEIGKTIKNLIERSKKFKGPEKRMQIYDLILESNFLDGRIKIGSDRTMKFTDRKFQRDIRDVSLRISKLLMENHDIDSFHRILNMDEFKTLFLFFAIDQQSTDHLAAAMLEFFEVFRKKSIQSPQDLETRESLLRIIQHLKRHRSFDLEEMTFYDVYSGKKSGLKGIIRLLPKRMYMKIYKYKRNMITLMGLYLANSDRWEVEVDDANNEWITFGDDLPLSTEGILISLIVNSRYGMISGEMVDSSTTRLLYGEDESYASVISVEPCFELQLYLP